MEKPSRIGDHEPMRVLLVGAGAVGIVYAAHLVLGGAEVLAYVRPSRRDEARAGWDLHRVAMVGARHTEHWTPRAILSSAAEIKRERFDQVWIATATNALFEPWLPQLLGSCGDALIVYLQPGQIAVDRMRALVPSPDRLVHGAIPFASWRTPLEGSTDPAETAASAGYAYFIPPLSVGGFEGQRASEVIALLKRGGFPAGKARVAESLARTSSILLPHVVALELAGWSFSALRTSPLSGLAAKASREAGAIAAKELGIGVPLAQHFVAAPLTRLLLGLTPILAPFDLPTYMRVHFLKVRAQTIQILDEYISKGRELTLSTDALAALRQRAQTP